MTLISNTPDADTTRVGGRAPRRAPALTATVREGSLSYGISVLPRTPWLKNFARARAAVRRADRSAARHHLAERLEVGAVEPPQLHLLDRPEVGRAGVHLDAFDQHRDLRMAQARRLRDDVRARQVLAARGQHLDQRHRRAVAVDRVGVVD